MLAYFALILVIVLDFLLEYLWRRKNKNIDNENKQISFKIINFIFTYRILTIISLVMLTTFRAYSVGLDTKSYLNYYNNMKLGKKALFSSISSPFEIGFTFLSSIYAWIGADFRVLIFTIALFTAIVTVLFVNKISNNRLMSILLYIMLGVYAQSISAMRQIIAIDFMLLAIMFLYNKKWIKSLILILVASLFHVSALVCLALIPLRYLKFKTWHLVIILGVVIGASFAFPAILKIIEALTPLDFYTKYMVNYTGFIGESSLVDNLYSIGLIFVYIVMLCSKKFLKFEEDKKDKYNFFLNIFLIVPLIRIAGFICKMQALFNRVSMYFFVALIILIPLFVDGISKDNKKVKVMAKCGVYIVGTIFMVYLYAVKKSCGVVPYLFG